MSTALLALGLADRVGEQDSKLEYLECHFEKLGGSKLQWIKVQALVTKPDWDTNGWNPWESEESKGEDAVGFDNETVEKPLPSDP